MSLPFLDLAGYDRTSLRRDLVAAAAVTFLSIPQGVAYAMIAGLPPAMGLYAGCVPGIVGSLLRSSRHVVTGPTNALSLLVGTAGVAATGLDPVPAALLLALIVGAIQVSAGWLRLGALADYISIPVVVGYLTGAGILIGAGQLHHVTATPGGSGVLFERLGTWIRHLGETNAWALAVSVGTAAAILVLRRIDRRIPGAMVMLSLATLLSWLFHADRLGLARVVDVTPIPVGLPPLTNPFGAGALEHAATLLPVAVAATVLSLVESSAVGRAIGVRSGQRVDPNADFVGQGLANVVAAFFGGYPNSGSLVRSTLNFESGAATRMAGVLGGLMMLAVLVLGLGPAVNHTPIAALAGLLLVVAVDLVDVARIRQIAQASRSDLAAFVVTLAGTWVLRLDHAIYVGVAVSVVLFLRRARLLTLHYMVFDETGRPYELRVDDPAARERGCEAVRMLQVEGQLFFGAAGELAAALDELIADRSVHVVLLRLRRAYGMDVSILQTLETAAKRLSDEGRHLMLVGVRPDALGAVERTGLAGRLGEGHVFPTTLKHFEAADEALRAALREVPDHVRPCPIERHLDNAP